MTFLIGIDRQADEQGAGIPIDDQLRWAVNGLLTCLTELKCFTITRLYPKDRMIDPSRGAGGICAHILRIQNKCSIMLLINGAQVNNLLRFDSEDSRLTA